MPSVGYVHTENVSMPFKRLIMPETETNYFDTRKPLFFRAAAAGTLVLSTTRRSRLLY